MHERVWLPLDEHTRFCADGYAWLCLCQAGRFASSHCAADLNTLGQSSGTCPWIIVDLREPEENSIWLHDTRVGIPSVRAVTRKLKKMMYSRCYAPCWRSIFAPRESFGFMMRADHSVFNRD